MPVEGVLVIRRYKLCEWLPDQLVPVEIEQRPGPQIGFHNRAL
jgi:hypothetical protein